MLVLRSPNQASLIADPELRALVQQRFTQVSCGEAFDSDRHGYFVVAEAGDSAEDLEHALGCPILHDTFGEVRFGDSEFAPASEVIEDHGGFYELTFILNDDGYGIALFVPKVDGADSELLAMCEAYAIPSEEVSQR